MKETEEGQAISKSEKLEQAVGDFIKHLESLADTYPLLTTTLKGTSAVTRKQFNDFLKEECILTSEATKSYKVPVDKINKKNKLKRKLDNTKLAEELVPRNFIVSLVSEFDAYLGRLIRVIYYLRPELLNTSDKNLSFTKLLELNSIEEGREFIIEKEVETVLRDSHLQQFKWLENKIDTKLTVDLKSWSTFIELTERRNLFVHNNGIVNNQYISVCKTNQVNLPENLKAGDHLNITSAYFHSAYRCVFEIGVKLSQVIWRKFIPDETLNADINFIENIFDQICRKDHVLAIELAEFSTHKVIKHHNEDIRLTCILNKAQAYKWHGNDKKCLEIVSDIDWSACSDKFKLASSVLVDNFGEASIAMKRLGKDDKEVTKECYKDWPIFQKFIHSEEFLKTFEEIFGCKFQNPEILAKISQPTAEIIPKMEGKESFN